MYGVYPNDIVAEVMNNNDIHENNNAKLCHFPEHIIFLKIDVTQTILKSNIINYLGNILLDSAALVSLFNEIFIHISKNKFLILLLLPGANNMIHTAMDALQKNRHKHIYLSL